MTLFPQKTQLLTVKQKIQTLQSDNYASLSSPHDTGAHITLKEGRVNCYE